jgi:hypothetical protein
MAVTAAKAGERRRVARNAGELPTDTTLLDTDWAEDWKKDPVKNKLI